MCSPTLAIAAFSAVATVSQGYAAKQKGEYDNQVAQYNARVQENQATQTQNKGTEAENAMRQRTAQLTSMQRAQMGANNVDLSTGSASTILQDTAMLGEADAMRIKSNYGFEAKALNDQAVLTRNQGAAAQAAGDSAFTTSLFSAGASFIGGSGLADKWFTPASAATVGNGMGNVSTSLKGFYTPTLG